MGFDLKAHVLKALFSTFLSKITVLCTTYVVLDDPCQPVDIQTFTGGALYIILLTNLSLSISPLSYSC